MRRTLMNLGAVVALLGAATFSCTGTITEPGSGEVDGPGGTNPASAACKQWSAGPSPMRRLTRWEYDNTVHDLLGDTTRPGSKFVPEAEQFGFDNNAAGATLNQLVVQQYEEAARTLVENAMTDPTALLGCDPAAQGEDTCAHAFIRSFGRRAFRRPLGSEEIARFESFYAANKAAHGFTDAVGMVARAMLQSPSFLYRLEIGTAEPTSNGALPLTPFETASRLSYLLWGSMPDEELLLAAESGQLSTPEQVGEQARRMLNAEHGARALKNFYVQWLGIEEIEQLDRAGTDLDVNVAKLLRQETETFVDEVVRKGDGKLSTLLTSPVSYRNGALASYYGEPGPTTDTFQQVALDPSRHSGLLTHGSLMATLAHPGLPSAVLRGQFVLDKLLCSPVPPPPDDVDTTPPTTDATGTAREKLEAKTANEPCNNCHSKLNPPGFAFEHFDETGRWRDLDHGLPIDASGTLIDTDVDGAFADHVELAKKLQSSAEVRSCVVLGWFRYAYGLTQDDACSEAQLETVFEKSDGNVRELLIALTQTPAFLYRSAHEGGAP
jgi:hypothetical protein